MTQSFTMPASRDPDTYVRYLAGQIREWFVESATNQDITNLAHLILAKYDTKEGDHLGQAKAIQNFVGDHINYVADPHGAELIVSPMVLAHRVLAGQYAVEDCDGLSVFAAALLRNIGIDATVAFIDIKGSDSEGTISHAMTLANINGQDYLLEVSHAGKAFGWHPEYTIIYVVTPDDSYQLQTISV